MKQSHGTNLNRQILEEASEWFVDFRVQDVNAASRARFDEWLRRSPEHIRAYMEIAKVYVDLPTYPADSIDIASIIALARSETNIVPLGGTAGTSGHPPRPPAEAQDSNDPRSGTRVPPSHRRRRFLQPALVALTLTIAAVFVWLGQRDPIYTTDIGERRLLTLSDGSTVDLNARSKIRIEFSGTERRVELLEGQVLFQVAKDKSRPFIVQGGAATVRAVGTQFDVYRKASGTTVTVLEGRVAVYSTPAEGGRHAGSADPSEPNGASPEHSYSRPRAAAHSAVARASGGGASTSAVGAEPPGLTPDGAAASATVFLSAGEQVTMAPDAVPVAHRADIATAAAWTQRRLVFDGTKLSDVVDELNRYSRRQLVLEGSQLSDFHISGVYSSTDPDSLLRFLRAQPGVKIIETDTEIRITAQ